METIIKILISIIPVVFLLWYFERQDKGEKEPRTLKRKIFILGIFGTIFAAIAELNLEGFFEYISITPDKSFWIYIFLTCFISVGLIEEAVKYFIVKKFAYRSPFFNETMDGITYTIIASMGFALLENVLYVLEGGIAIGVVRAFMSVPSHALFSGIMGYYIGKSRNIFDQKERTKTLLKGFLLGVFYHGLFDFVLFSENTLIILTVIPLIIVMGMHLKYLIKKARFLDKVEKEEPQQITAKKIIKTVFAIMLSIIGIANIIIGIYLYVTNPLEYTKTDIIASSIFAIILIYLSYILLRKKNPSESK
jgi:protease PrsW